MIAAKGAWVVKAGIIPKEPRQEFTKRFDYDSRDLEADQQIKHPWEVAKFSKVRAEATDYFLQISDPSVNNWATIEFIWY